MRLSIGMYIANNLDEIARYAKDWPRSQIEFSDCNMNQFKGDLIRACLWKDLAASIMDFSWQVYHAQSKVKFDAFEFAKNSNIARRRRSLRPPDYLVILAYLRFAREVPMDVDISLDMSLVALCSAVKSEDYITCIVLHDFFAELHDRNTDAPYKKYMQCVQLILRNQLRNFAWNAPDCKYFPVPGEPPDTQALREATAEAIDLVADATESTSYCSLWNYIVQAKIV